MPRTIFSRLSAVLGEVRQLQDGKAGISVQALEVFTCIAAKEGISSSELRKNTGIPQPSVSRALGDLGDWAGRRGAEGLKLIRTERDPLDQRNVVCFLTPTGKLLAARIEQLMGATNSGVD
ncbi:MarR family winged helix-turn-helix transcriptional regulator [Agrobacterium sp. 16-172Ci]